MSMEQEDPIARIAANQLGQQPAPPAPPPSAPQADTAMDKAQTDAAPTTADDKTNMEPVQTFKVNIDGVEQELSGPQIAGTFARYRDLNHKHAQRKDMEPFDNMVSKLSESGKPRAEIIGNMFALMKKGMEKNATMGDDGVPSARPAEDAMPSQDIGSEDPYERWTRENDLSTMPPGFREQQAKMDQLTQAVGAIQSMLQPVLASAQGTAQKAVQSQEAANQMKVDAAKDRIAANMDRLADSLGLTEEDAPMFNEYIKERGFGFPDFEDPNLLKMVLTDYTNAKNGPEMDRLRAINERRQAYQGTMVASPADGASPAPSGADEMISRLADKQFGKNAGMA